jgi:hypothetical protein
MSEPGFWITHEAEAKSLREYLLKGGFIIFDDFEGEGHMRNLRTQMKQALPDHDFIRLDVSSPVFQSFFGIRHLEVPHPNYNGPPAFYGMFENNDPAGRLIAIANFNNEPGRLLGVVGRRALRQRSHQRRLPPRRELHRLRDDTLNGCDGAMVRWCDGATVRWCDGAMVRRCDGATVRWCDITHCPLLRWRCSAAIAPAARSASAFIGASSGSRR